MSKFPEATERLFDNVWVCMRCNATNRTGGAKPTKCRKCHSKRLRGKKKTAKKVQA